MISRTSENYLCETYSDTVKLLKIIGRTITFTAESKRFNFNVLSMIITN